MRTALVSIYRVHSLASTLTSACEYVHNDSASMFTDMFGIFSRYEVYRVHHSVLAC